MLRRVFAVVVISLAFASAGCSKKAGTREGEHLLSGKEIKQLFRGKTVKGQHLVHGYSFKSYYEPSGTFRSHQSDKSQPRKARWWVTGNDICVHWEDEQPPGDLCRKMIRTETGVYVKIKPRKDGDRVDIVTFHSFSPGNPENL